jgi:Tol biopolymer transport system component
MGFPSARPVSVRSLTALATLAAASVPFVAESAPKGPATELISVSTGGVTGSGHSSRPVISANGRFVAFSSTADDLVPGDTNGRSDVFVRDRKTGATTRVSVAGDGGELTEGGYSPSISANGRYVAFMSTDTAVVVGKTSNRPDVIVRDLKTGTNRRASVDSDGNETDGDAYQPLLSANGRFVAFGSEATDLVPGDTNARYDIFVHDMRTGSTVRVSVDSDGNQQTSSGETHAFSSNGRFVAFSTNAANLVPGDTNGQDDIFVHDMKTRRTTRVSTSTAGAEADGPCYGPSISTNGRWVSFSSSASNLVPINVLSLSQIYLHDVKTGVTTRISGSTSDNEGNGPSQSASMTPNGRLVVFSSRADNLVVGDTNGEYDIFLHDLRRGVLARVSVDSAGQQAADDDSYESAISANGRFVAFASGASNLAAGDANTATDVFVRTLK